MFTLIAAIDLDGGIGKGGKIPWNLKPDMRHFYNLTVYSTVIMGRKTWESLPQPPLKNRLNLVVSSTKARTEIDNVLRIGSFKEALSISDGDIKVIGGQMVYEQAITHPECEGIHLTRVFDQFNCDRSFPLKEMINRFKLINQSELKDYKGLQYEFSYWKNRSL